MTINYLEILGMRIRERRKACGYSQEQFADLSSLDRSYLGGVERGQRNLTFKVLCQICLALDCEVSELTAGIPKKCS